MIERRLLTRTHYQVDEPAYMKTLVQKCTSADRSQIPERVAGRFVEEVRRNNISFNLPAASYAVDLARGLGLLTENLVWTDLGQLLNVVCRGDGDGYKPHLSLPERLLFFRLLLEADGGAIVFIARLTEKTDMFPPKGKSWANFANQMFVDVFSGYLDLVTDPATRTRLRQQIEKRRRYQYSGKSGPHQSFIHVNTLYRIGLLRKIDGRGSRSYTAEVDPESDIQPLHRLRKLIPDLAALEEVIRNRSWPEIAQYVFFCRSPVATKESDKQSTDCDRLLKTISCTYNLVIRSGAPLCPLTTLAEAVQIDQIASGEQPLSYKDVLRYLKRVQQKQPDDVDFHVDRLGRPAYVRLKV